MLSKKRGFHALTLTLVLTVFASTTAFADAAITLTHVHGLSYSADGGQLLIPSHHGLAVFSEDAGLGRRAPRTTTWASRRRAMRSIAAPSCAAHRLTNRSG